MSHNLGVYLCMSVHMLKKTSSSFSPSRSVENWDGEAVKLQTSISFPAGCFHGAGDSKCQFFKIGKKDRIYLKDQGEAVDAPSLELLGL